MSFSGAIFDLDGTLLDSMWIWHTVDQTYLTGKGKIPEQDLSRKLSRKSMMESVAYFQEAYAIDEPAEQMAAELWGLAEHAYRDLAPLKPHVYNFVKELRRRNIRCVVATASDREFTKAALRRCGILDCFTDVVTCDAIGKSKASPDVFFAALERIGCSQEETIVFEDALHAIETAKQAGFRVTAVADRAAAADEQEIRRTADNYVTSLIDWNFEREN